MNTGTKIEETPKEQPKSKRLSSLIWIFVLWGGVRACSEMDGISWERAFSGVALMFGVWPASAFLLISTLPRMEIHQSLLRWASFFVVIGSFSSGLLCSIFSASERNGDHASILLQALISLLICLMIIHRWTGSSND